MTVLSAKTERTWLHRSDQMGVKQTQNHITHAAETRHRAQVLCWMLGQGTSRPKRVDRDAKQRQHAREGILLGECRLKISPPEADNSATGPRPTQSLRHQSTMAMPGAGAQCPQARPTQPTKETDRFPSPLHPAARQSRQSARPAILAL
jgi:hypothetical protein